MKRIELNSRLILLAGCIVLAGAFGAIGEGPAALTMAGLAVVAAAVVVRDARD